MKTTLPHILLTATLLAAGLLSSPQSEAKGRKKLHRLPVRNIEQVRKWFRYTGPSDAPLISGHRGCRENGCPENSLLAYEYALEHLPAFFEIDPRMTRDSVIVILHDPTLDRTTTGSGTLAERRWDEIKDLRLKDIDGNVTEEKIPTLDDVIRWSRGKTVINLDVYTPKEVLAAKLKEHGFPPHVMLTIHTPEQAQYYYDLSPETMFSIHINSLEKLEAFEKTTIDWRNVMAYVGPAMRPEQTALYERLHAKGVRCMISLAPTVDRLPTPQQRKEGYLDLDILPDVIESDYPIELAGVLKSLKNREDRRR